MSEEILGLVLCNPLIGLSEISVPTYYTHCAYARRKPAQNSCAWAQDVRGSSPLHGSIPATNRSAHLRIFRCCQCDSFLLSVCDVADDADPASFSLPRDERSRGSVVTGLPPGRAGIRNSQLECNGGCSPSGSSPLSADFARDIDGDLSSAGSRPQPHLGISG